MNYDIVIATLPKTYFDAPLLAPSLLKSVLKEKGFECRVVDWNYDFYKRSKDTEVFDKAEFLSTNDSMFVQWSLFKEIWEMGLNEMTNQWVDELIEYNPKWFGLTLFSDANFHVAYKLLEIIREKAPHIIIVAGSDGVASPLRNPNVGEYLKKKGLLDYYIVGEAENTLVELMKGNVNYPGINGNGFDKTVDISSQPLPDYSDLDMKGYNALWIMGSRGCVNKCAFCESNRYYKGYRLRSPKNISDEMITLKDTYNIHVFNFADNVINANLKHLRELCKLLKGHGFKWYGQTVCNPKMQDEDFKLMHEAGVFHVTLGIESGCERIRKEMGKQYTNDELKYYLHTLAKYNITVRASLIVGWFTESEEDFQETLDFLTYTSKHKIIKKISPGGTLTTGAYRAIGKDIPMYKDYNHLLEWDEHDNWIYKDNSMPVRVKRWVRLRDHCLKLGLITHEIRYAKMNNLHIKYFGVEMP